MSQFRDLICHSSLSTFLSPPSRDCVLILWAGRACFFLAHLIWRGSLLHFSFFVGSWFTLTQTQCHFGHSVDLKSPSLVVRTNHHPDTREPSASVTYPAGPQSPPCLWQGCHPKKMMMSLFLSFPFSFLLCQSLSI
jgi:hypothetical protein